MKSLVSVVAVYGSLLQLTTTAAWVSQRSIARRGVSVPVQAQDDSSAESFRIALTREEGKNGKLMKGITQLENKHFQPFELPCIAHASGPDYDRLQGELESNKWDYVTITSPEAARVFLSAWSKCSSDMEQPAVAAVGKATEAALRDGGVDVSFCPSKATAAVLVDELPETSTTSPKVLYPASARAQTTLQDGLAARGFQVVRLDTYDTVTAEWSVDQVSASQEARIACFASPSAVKGWLLNSNDNRSVLAACIGETSAAACRKMGWSDEAIFYPDKPGMEGWVAAIEQAAASLMTTKAS